MNPSGRRIRAVAPGRVNLIGEYTDLIDGMVLPLAVGLSTTVEGVGGGDHIELRSADEAHPVVVPIDEEDPVEAATGWGRLVAAVVTEVRPEHGFTGSVTTTLPIGAGLSSSAALTVALALALGFDGDPVDLAGVARRAEQRGTGVPCGIMDPLTSAAGVDGAALLVDCSGPTIEPVPVSDDLEIRIVHTGISRRLVSSAYADRKAALDRAAEQVGPLRLLDDPGRVDALDDPALRRRARHVVTENRRVRDAAMVLRDGDHVALGEILSEGHASLRDDLEVSLPEIDELVRSLIDTPGVHGARLTGAGFGGCVVVVSEPGVLDVGRSVRPSAGAHRSGRSGSGAA